MAAKVSYFLQIGGLKGTSKERMFKGAIECLTYSIGPASSSDRIAGSGGGAGKWQFKDFFWSFPLKNLDPTYTQLILSLERRTLLDHALFTTRQNLRMSGNPYIYTEFEFADMSITSLTIGSGPDVDDYLGPVVYGRLKLDKYKIRQYNA